MKYEKISRRELCDLIVQWCGEFKSYNPGPDPIRFGHLGRRWGKIARHFDETLKSIMESDGRFAFTMDTKGAYLVAVRSVLIDADVADDPLLRRMVRLQELIRADGLTPNADRMRAYWATEFKGEPYPDFD